MEGDARGEGRKEEKKRKWTEGRKESRFRAAEDKGGGGDKRQDLQSRPLWFCTVSLPSRCSLIGFIMAECADVMRRQDAGAPALA